MIDDGWLVGAARDAHYPTKVRSAGCRHAGLAAGAAYTAGRTPGCARLRKRSTNAGSRAAQRFRLRSSGIVLTRERSYEQLNFFITRLPRQKNESTGLRPRRGRLRLLDQFRIAFWHRDLRYQEFVSQNGRLRTMSPGSRFGAAKQRIHRACRFLLHLRCDVCIQVSGDADLRVSQLFHDLPHRQTLLEHQ